jgi:hypothetical protein
MTTKLSSLILFVFITFLFACDPFDKHVIPSDDVSSRNEHFEDYDMIDASSAFSVYVTFSEDEESIEIEANDNLHQYIEVKKTNNTLHVGLKNNVSIRKSPTLNVFITTKLVNSYSASGASRFFIESPLTTEDVSVYLSGASKFTGDLEVETLSADLSGASAINISGTSGVLSIEASGASVFKDYGFSTDNLDAEISGASSIHLTVNDNIRIEASGASSLRYKGAAVIQHHDLSGASSIKKIN